MNRRRLLAALSGAIATMGLSSTARAKSTPKWTLLNQTEPQPLRPRGAEFLGAGEIDGDPVMFLQIVDSPAYPRGVIQTWRIS